MHKILPYISLVLIFLLCYRLINLFGEEQATEDAIYCLSEALRKGVLDLDVFLKVGLLA